MDGAAGGGGQGGGATEGRAQGGGVGRLRRQQVPIHAAAGPPLGQHRVGGAPGGQRGAFCLEGLGQLATEEVDHWLHIAPHIHLLVPQGPTSQDRPVTSPVSAPRPAPAGMHLHTLVPQSRSTPSTKLAELADSPGTQLCCQLGAGPQLCLPNPSQARSRTPVCAVTGVRSICWLQEAKTPGVRGVSPEVSRRVLV